jgi:transposase
VWAAEGHSAEVLGAFFQQLGPQRCSAVRTVTIDMAGGYYKAIRQWLPEAEIVFDRFHVQRLASDALDEVRRSLVRDLARSDEGQEIKNLRYVLLKNPWHLTPPQRHRLSELQDTNRRLYRAYLLKETLARALDYRQPKRARDALKAWLAWASRSKLPPFVKAARTIRKHLDGILAYVHTRLSNGLVEGLNTKLRMVARRAFGFHSASALISMLFLCCGGVELDPPLPTRS